MNLGLTQLITLAMLAASPSYEPTSNYSERDAEGWRVHVHERLLDEKASLGNASLKLLETKLYEIKRIVSPDALAKLYKVPIWMEVANDHQYPCICYHVSADWVAKNGYNPAKARAIEITNAARFLRWTHAQPDVLLHELAHAYHHRVLGHDDQRIRKAHRRAVASQKYDNVMRYNTRRERHYGLKNHREFFAEMTESYFGTNDYFPFIRAELRQHDLATYRLMKEIWGDVPSAHDPE